MEIFLLLLTLLQICSSQWQEIDISFYISQLWFSGSPDELYFKICDVDNKCGKFEYIPNGWSSEGETYSYTYKARNIGTPQKVYIVLEGSEMLCIGHIYVNNIEYDEEQCGICLDLPVCIEDTGGGCDTMIIDLPTNSWSTKQTVPCEYSKSELNSIYTNPPTLVPTQKPTKKPTKFPTIDPTLNPSMNPTEIPTKIPTNSPTLKPTHTPSTYPTNIPTYLPTYNPLQSTESFISETNDNLSIGSNSNNDNSNAILIGGLVGGLIFLFLCVCCLLLMLLYFWRKKKNTEDGVDEINRTDITRIYDQHHHYHIEGGATIPSTIKPNSTQTILSTTAHKEQANLLVDDTDEDEDDMMYIEGIGTTKDNVVP